jgi:hypothetical protein
MPSKQSVAELAYHLWLARGRPQGSSDTDWFEAERLLAVTSETMIDDSLQESFPASDPPASHLPDVPPANAADKWAAAGLAPRTKDRSRSRNRNQPPVDETDDAVATAPGDIGGG